MAQSIHDKILARIYGKKRGWVFTPRNFLDLGSRDAVDKTLGRLTKAATIRRLARGLYDYPKKHPKLGLVSPNPDVIARALCERDDSRIQPSGAYALNLLGLSQQVPAHIIYQTDSTTRTVNVGNQSIHLLRTTPRNMATAGRTSGLVIQAFRHIGAGRVTDEQIKTLRQTLSQSDRDQLWKDQVHAPAWMRRHFFEILQDTDS